jgi:ABC-type branched-subunit amino acid transport system substrate-binding protein
VRRAAVPIVAALSLAGLAGCGSGSRTGTAKPHFASLCVEAGLPLSGQGAAAGRGVLTGLRMQIPAAGLAVGGYRIRLCRTFDDGGGAGAVVADARQAAEDVRTIAYVGELSGSLAGLADAVLAQAGIALITPSGPVPAPVGLTTPGTPAAPPARRTVLYLLPSARTQSDAVGYVRSVHACGARRRGRPACTVISASSAPLCTGIVTSRAGVPPRFCVLAGPNLASGWASPAVAYGDSAGQLLVASLRAVAADGKDVADRATVLAALSRANLKGGPIGAIRFDSQGGIEADDFSAYTVGADGALALSSLNFHTH